MTSTTSASAGRAVAALLASSFLATSVLALAAAGSDRSEGQTRSATAPAPEPTPEPMLSGPFVTTLAAAGAASAEPVRDQKVDPTGSAIAVSAAPMDPASPLALAMPAIDRSPSAPVADAPAPEPLGGPAPEVVISEIRLTGTAGGTCNDVRVSYVELKGTPGTALDPYSFIQIGEGTFEGNSGVMERQVTLTGLVMPDDGRFLMVNPIFCINIPSDIDFIWPGSLGDVDNLTFLLVRGLFVSSGIDLDFDNNCSLDFEPWSVTADGVSFRRSDVDGCVYQIIDPFGFPVVRPFEPDAVTGLPAAHAFRCEPTGAWVEGSDVVTIYQPGVLGAADSPGTINPDCLAVTCPLEGECCESHIGLGCEDDLCCLVVCGIDHFCCDTGWDQQCADLAEFFCICTPPAFLPLCPDQPGLGSCFAIHGGPGCESSECEAVVCAAAAFCCTTFWDVPCVALALEFCTCGNPFTPGCTVVHPTPGCNDCNCCTLVCQADLFCCDVEWDGGCVGLASFLCTTCGSTGSGNCCFAHVGPSCDDAECCATVCATFVDCCVASWDLDCAFLASAICESCDFCDQPGAGSCFVAHEPGGCDDLECCVRVCSDDVYCCGVAWDSFCSAAALSRCVGNQTCDDIGAGITCFDDHPQPGCSDLYCCFAICNQDPPCCEVAWDVPCVDLAFEVCGFTDLPFSLQGPAGDVAVPGGSGSGVGPGSGAAIGSGGGAGALGLTSEDSLLAPDVGEFFADLLGTIGCGSFNAGSCINPHGEPFCDNRDCCLVVCGNDISCCLNGWDTDCVLLALDVCCGLATAGNCFVADGAPFCDDAACCDDVCFLERFCCEESWDQLCAQLALENCDIPCVDGSPAGIRSCFLDHDRGGCDIINVCRGVCLVDPYCCEVRWDVFCVQTAEFFPAGVPYAACTPTLGSCYEPHPAPGCTDELCCKATCSIDPECCTGQWDSFCVQQAELLCLSGLFPFPPVCPGEGDCLIEQFTPGCEDQACCIGVCSLDASCCLASWDFICVFYATTLCDEFVPPFCSPGDEPCDPTFVFGPDEVTPIGVEIPCSCLTVHPTPYCINSECSDVVCIFQEQCCADQWDIVCVSAAELLCGGGSGSILSGDCFVPEVTNKGCKDWACSERTCSVDIFCCLVAWDGVCAQLAFELCRGGSCFAIQQVAGCDTVTIMAKVCGVDEFCCSAQWDVGCVELAQEFFLPSDGMGGPGMCVGGGCVPVCGNPNAGGCFGIKTFPFCDDSACCTAVCKEDTFCCSAAWDEICVLLAKDVCQEEWADIYFEPGELCAGNCFLIKETPNCNDEPCTVDVCAEIAECCTIAWDEECVDLARFFCAECGSDVAGNCCIPHNTPYCSQEACCEMVCAVDGFCCALGGSWDSFCVQIAQQLPCMGEGGDPLCPTSGCGDPDTGSCFSVKSTPYCNDEECCESICGLFDDFCCTSQWDETCVQYAQDICLP